MATNSDIDYCVEKMDFDDKLKYLNKKVLQRKQTCKGWKINSDLTNKVAQTQEKGYDFLLGRI